jgi:thiamine phosphate synthase YjbQ (UPF0047 family)
MLMETVQVRTGRRTQLLDVTEEVQRAVTKSGIVAGMCYLLRAAHDGGGDD